MEKKFQMWGSHEGSKTPRKANFFGVVARYLPYQPDLNRNEVGIFLSFRYAARKKFYITDH